MTFTCQHCPLTFKYRSGRTRHKRNVHDVSSPDISDEDPLPLPLPIPIPPPPVTLPPEPAVTIVDDNDDHHAELFDNLSIHHVGSDDEEYVAAVEHPPAL